MAARPIIHYPPFLQKEGRSGNYLGQRLDIGVRLLCFPTPDPRDHHGGVLPYFRLNSQDHPAWSAEIDSATMPARPDAVATVGNNHLRVGLNAHEYQLLHDQLAAVWDSPEGQATLKLLAERDDAAEMEETLLNSGRVCPALLHAQGSVTGAALVYTWVPEAPRAQGGDGMIRLCQRLPVYPLPDVSVNELRDGKGAYLGWTTRNGGLYAITPGTSESLRSLQHGRAHSGTLPTPRAGPPGSIQARPTGSWSSPHPYVPGRSHGEFREEQLQDGSARVTFTRPPLL